MSFKHLLTQYSPPNGSITKISVTCVYYYGSKSVANGILEQFVYFNNYIINHKKTALSIV